ncbi:uncharacterized protein BO72DRAFT_443515 [Aspergillus fijiensis CBS 313.89]|uniref:Uncharacterized protein n=1 Tax=Aspergillus fijiensis CBS 313.89 TaxID=1448319 RepID=A0A8G1S390_9EURO|nr:uncharacterized protein BO72DRAFT_443515 [Aspergillus fijiensis CBS 313.89]RAK82660.1 hypothetical protein BO72DRAFT_443515 [Aspergillus fijiensis CBS 313.89]
MGGLYGLTVRTFLLSFFFVILCLEKVLKLKSDSLIFGICGNVSVDHPPTMINKPDWMSGIQILLNVCSVSMHIKTRGDVTCQT